MQLIVAVLFLAAAANAAAMVPVVSSVVKKDLVHTIYSNPDVVPDVQHVVPTTYVASGVPVEVKDGEVVTKVMQNPYFVSVGSVIHDPMVTSAVPYVYSVDPVVNQVPYGYGYPYGYPYGVVKV